MLSCGGYRSIAIVHGKIFQTINCVYLRLPKGNPALAELEALQSERLHILYHRTSVASAVSTARHVGSCVVWLHNKDNLRTTQFAPRCSRSECLKVCVM